MEQKEYAEVFNYCRIAEKSGIITDYCTDNPMDLILRKDNLNKTYQKVKSNKGAGGTDVMEVDELLTYLKEKQDGLCVCKKISKSRSQQSASSNKSVGSGRF